MTSRNDYHLHRNVVNSRELSPEQLQRQVDAVAAYHKRLARRAMWNRVCGYAFTALSVGALLSVFLLATN